MPTFAEYLEKWLKLSTAQGLTNPLVKMPVKRFRFLQPDEFDSLSNGGKLTIGTISDPIARNLFKNYQTRIRERGEHCAFVCSGSIERIIAGGKDGKQRKQLFPVSLKRAALQTVGDKIKVTVAEDEGWQLNPVLEAQLRDLAIEVPSSVAGNPTTATSWIKSQMGNRASNVTNDSYIGLFSSQQMVVQNRLNDPPLRLALAKNPVVQSKIAGTKIEAINSSEISDEGLEELGLSLPCDDSQLRVIQLSDRGCSLQVEGPPGTGKSQTIANIISNALYKAKNVLLVCDKKAAIVQVEERLSNAGLEPAMLNLHDEDLDKREFLQQATRKFNTRKHERVYPFGQLQEARQTLNDRVKFGRTMAHPSLQVTKREALAGMIQLRKELESVPNIPIANWQALSKERLAKLLGHLGEWNGLSDVLADNSNIWNTVSAEGFDDNPNATNELKALLKEVANQIDSLEVAKEWAASVGMELPLSSDADVVDMLTLVQTVVDKPVSHARLIGNHQVSISELNHLKGMWDEKNSLIAARHPVPLGEIYPAADREEVERLLAAENVKTWSELSQRKNFYKAKFTEIEANQTSYKKLCDQIGLLYSPYIKTRRAQLQAILSLASLKTTIPRSWWKQDTTPVLDISAWKAHFQSCAHCAKDAPLSLHFLALERVMATHWQYIESKAENGFSFVGNCLNFVVDRKCKYALRQIFPSIPQRGFDQWPQLNDYAVSTYHAVNSLRAAAETHAVIKQLTSAYFAIAHDEPDSFEKYLSLEEVTSLEKVAAIVERMRQRNDLFEVENVHWQTFWESVNASFLNRVEAAIAELDSLILPDTQEGDNLDDALATYEKSRQRITHFLERCEKQEGNRDNAILDAFSAQKSFDDCENELLALSKYLKLRPITQETPDWDWLHTVITWRDSFESLRGEQRLDIDSQLWVKLHEHLTNQQSQIHKAYSGLNMLFEKSLSGLPNYNSLAACISEILIGLPQRPLWLEKKRWQLKIGAFPEIEDVWNKILSKAVAPSHAPRLFCFNLLRLCSPIAHPQGLEFQQTLKTFREHDEKLTSWVIDRLKVYLCEKMDDVAIKEAQSESELRRLSGLQRIRGTVRELVNMHMDYLLEAKPCWLMSPTSLANLVDSNIFEKHGVPFDLVIFDEASQIRVLDGMLSMAFAKQVIIVGDKNQLPPTDFFAGFASPEEDIEDLGTSASLLEEFGGVFEENKTQIMLMSHYRSETPDLIRFSNDSFYGGQLEMYPPAHITGIGRRLHYVPDAIYSKFGQRNNPAEAEETIKLIELHVRDNPEKSLGVVTMNISQLELVEKLLLEVPEKVRNFCADETKFFLRNLETVQGDEMDRIILSLTYGKNKEGRFNASVLGPLNKGGGERRLNVAITRSRSGMTIVSSMKVTDLLGTNAQSRGFNCLKEFLAELENEESNRAFGIGNKRFARKNDGVSNIVYCESPFEEQVVEFLENEGYDIECQYGAGRFRLDIVVKELGKNILAIECDGAAYHSSLVARTRDRARQRVLENMGWRIHRVWSTNWWDFEQQEKENLIRAINRARQRN